MRHTEFTSFDFHSGTSRDFDHLMERMGVSDHEEAVEMALTYYGLFLNGEYKGGNQLVACTSLMDDAFVIGDDIPDDYTIADYAQVPIDSQVQSFMTFHSRKSDASSMLSAAFAMMEKICNLWESGWHVGLHDRATHIVTPFIMSTSTREMSVEAGEALQRAMRPATLRLH